MKYGDGLRKMNLLEVKLILVNMTDNIVKKQKDIEPLTEVRRESKDIELFQIIDMIETVSSAPTETPTSFRNQFKIYKSGATKRFYWYDKTNGEWSYVTGT